jgi:integrase
MNSGETALSVILDKYVQKRLRDASPSTVAQYHAAIHRLEKHVGATPTVEHLDADTIESVMYSMKAVALAPRTCNKFRENVVALWNFAAKQGITKDFPDIKRLKEPRRKPKAWTGDEIDALFASCDQSEGEIGGAPARLWWRGLFLVMYDTAERKEAVLQLRWSDVKLDTGWVTFRAETRKRGAEDNLSRFHSATVALLKQMRRYQSPGETLVFPWTLGSGTIYHYLDKILVRAGLPTDRFSKFHCMRRSVASHFAAGGGDATRLLGHADQRTTTKHYLDPRIIGQQSAADVLRRPDSVTEVVGFSEGVG